MIWRVFIILAWCFISFNAQSAVDTDTGTTTQPPVWYPPDVPDIGGDDQNFADGDYNVYNDDRDIGTNTSNACIAMGYKVTERSLCNYKAFPCPLGNMFFTWLQGSTFLAFLPPRSCSPVLPRRLPNCSVLRVLFPHLFSSHIQKDLPQPQISFL